MHNAPMKRTLLPLLLLAPIALAGCQTIKSHNPFRHKEPAYKTAQQEQPLEVPPGMDTPPTTDALAIPAAGSGAQAGATATEAGAPPAATGSTASTGGATATTLTLPDTPDSVYHRVGLALARGDAGQVTGHDDTAHTYQVAVNTVVTTKPEGGFLHRVFHRSKRETVQGTVTVSVAPSGTGSEVSAAGNPDAAERVMAVLQQRLGGG